VNEVGATFCASRFRVIGSCRRARSENLFGNVPALECFAKLASDANDFYGELNEPLFQLIRECHLFQHRATDSNSRASDENWELSIDQIPHVPLFLHGCIADCLTVRFGLCPGSSGTAGAVTEGVKNETTLSLWERVG
jgi:hypothetical protein